MRESVRVIGLTFLFCLSFYVLSYADLPETYDEFEKMYQEYLYNEPLNYNYWDVHYTILDLNNDGIPEMIESAENINSDIRFSFCSWNNEAEEYVEPYYKNVNAIHCIGEGEPNTSLSSIRYNKKEKLFLVPHEIFKWDRTYEGWGAYQFVDNKFVESEIYVYHGPDGDHYYDNHEDFVCGAYIGWDVTEHPELESVLHDNICLIELMEFTEYNDDEPDDSEPDIPNEQTRGFKHSLDYYAAQSSCNYNPQLAYDLMKLAWDAYGPNTALNSHNVGTEDDIKKDYASLGFNVIQNYYSKNYYQWKYLEDYCGFSFASKEAENGGIIVVITVRGTVGGLSPVPSPEWISDLNVSVPAIGNKSWHQGLYKPACEILSSLEGKGLIRKSNTKYFITGHSRGAGVANVLSVLLSNLGISKENIYDYNFACPDTMHAEANTDWTASGKYNNIFNINAANDLVGVVPGVFGDYIDLVTKTASWRPWKGLYTWGKYGRTFFYSYDWGSNERSMINVIKFISDQGVSNPHQPKMYLDYLSKLNSTDSFKSYAQVKLQNIANDFKVSWGFCPVDMTLVDNKGTNIMAVVDGKVIYYNNYSMKDAMVLTDGDFKAFFVDPSINYSVKFVATDNGSMTFVSGITDFHNSTLRSEKTFSKVQLSSGKKFKTETINTGAVELYVTDNSGSITAEIQENGTEVPVNTGNESSGSQPSSGSQIGGDGQTTTPIPPAVNPQATVEPEPITIVKAPASVKTKVKKNKVTISWKKIKKNKAGKKLLSQIQSIQIQASTDPTFSSIVVDKRIGKNKTKIVLKLQKKTQYFIRARYVGNDGVSRWSSVKRVKTK